MARVDVPVMVEDKVRLWEGGRAVDALWGAVLEADATDDVGNALVLWLDCFVFFRVSVCKIIAGVPVIVSKFDALVSARRERRTGSRSNGLRGCRCGYSGGTVSNGANSPGYGDCGRDDDSPGGCDCGSWEIDAAARLGDIKRRELSDAGRDGRDVNWWEQLSLERRGDGIARAAGDSYGSAACDGGTNAVGVGRRYCHGSWSHDSGGSRPDD